MDLRYVIELMQPESYEALTEALKKLGMTAWMKHEDHLVVSVQEGAVWPNCGNSFWLSHRQGVWLYWFSVKRRMA